MKFIYPTKRNMFLGLLTAQLYLLGLFFFAKVNFTLENILVIEIVFIGCLSLWRPMPFNEMDERQKHVTYKWKSIMLEATMVSILVPLLAVILKPEIYGWTLFRLMSIPIFVCLIVPTLLYKRELGFFFYSTHE